jgi:energy-coupling factor transporter ATP-binding protein EcfA2
VVETFADLIHEQNRAGIMVTHDLRMTKYVDRVIHMVDGQVTNVLDDRQQIDILAKTSSFEMAEASAVRLPVAAPTYPLQIPSIQSFVMVGD